MRQPCPSLPLGAPLWRTFLSGRLTCCVLCVFILLVDALSSHEDFGLTVQRERAVIFPETVKQLHVFELSVLVTH